MSPNKGSAATALAVPESAGVVGQSFAVRARRDLESAWREAFAAFGQLVALGVDAPPLAVAEAADRLVSAAGAVYQHAHRVAETSPPK